MESIQVWESSNKIVLTLVNLPPIPKMDLPLKSFWTWTINIFSELKNSSGRELSLLRVT